MLESVFDQEDAKAINKARLEHLASLGLKFENSIVLEVGSGIGLLTGFFESLGCTILSTEARQVNIEEHRRRYPHRRVEFADISKPGSHNHFGEFDIVFCYGTLYHLSNPASAIKDMAKVCRNLLLLETCVYPIDNGNVNHLEEPPLLNQSFEGTGCRPARNWIFYELRKYFPHVYVTASQPDHPDFPLNWPVLNADQLTRAVFVASRTPLDLPTLLYDLPIKQYKMSSLKKSEESNLNNFIEGILFDDFRVSIDPKATKVGGSWQGTPRNGMPTAWDMEVIKFFYERTLEIENPTILDIGANTGTFCLLSKINQNIRGYAFEPTPVIYEILSNNIALNNLQGKIKPLSVALSEKKGTAVLKYPKSGTASGLACIGMPLRFNDWAEIEVPVTTLDDFATEEGIKRVDLIKIDTEGCELFVLKGGENLIRECYPGILTEYYEQNTLQFGYHAEEIKDLLFSWGYKGEKIGSEDMYFHHKSKSKMFSLPTDETVNREIRFEGKEKFRKWIAKFASAQNRLYCRDQTPESLNALVNFVHYYEPTKIIELGTFSGLSLRTWLSADTQAEVIAIDLSFQHLYESQKIVPIDLSRVKLIEQNALQTDFSRLWQADDKVLFYVDAHDLPNMPIMKHFLSNAVPALPTGSVVIVDDLWYSPTTLTNDNAGQFFENIILNEIDLMQCFEGFYAPYWKGGSFFGFPEVIPLMEWVNCNQVSLIFEQGIKSVTFEWPLKQAEK